TIRVNHAADCSNIAWPKLGDCRSNLSDTANDLMSRNAWIDSRRRAPLATDGVEVRVADTAEKDFDLNIIFTGIAPRNRHGSKRRFSTRSSISLRFILTM